MVHLWLVLTGTVGVLLGFGVAVYRDQPRHIYALSTGANFAVVTAVFLGKHGYVHMCTHTHTHTHHTRTPGIRHGILKLMVSEENISTHSTTLTPSTTLTMEQTEFVSSAASGGISLSLSTILSSKIFTTGTYLPHHCNTLINGQLYCIFFPQGVG